MSRFQMKRESGGIVLPTPRPKNEALANFLFHCGEAFFRSGVLGNARTAYELTIQANEDIVHAHNNLGRIALREGRLEDAADHFKRVMRFVPENYGTLVNMAIVRTRQEDFPAAIGFAERAIAQGEKHGCVNADPFFLLAAAYNETGNYSQEMDWIERGLALFPDAEVLRDARSVWNLLHGNWEQGWKDFEFRRRKKEAFADIDDQPEWDGSPLGEKYLLVFSEQGIGDNIQFSRYLGALREVNPKARIVYYSRPELARLLEGCLVAGYVDSIITSDNELNSEEFRKYDVWCSLLSLPYLLRLLHPHMGDVLATAPSDVAKFAHLFAGSGGLRVGLCWAGNPQHERDKYRSVRFAELSPLLDVPGCSFYGLQVHKTREDSALGSPFCKALEAGMVDATEDCFDDYDLACVIAHLDLVISVDTSIAHIAGAFGKQCWQLCYQPWEWRWGKEGSRTPWYYNTRLFRQDRPREWRPVIEEIRGSLTEVALSWAGPPRSQCERQPSVATIDSRYGQICYLTDDKWLGRSLSLYGEWSEGECDLYRRVIKPGDTVVEVGANIGAHAVPIAKICTAAPGGQLHAFEPNAAAYELLCGNLSNLGDALPRCWAYRRALGPASARGTLAKQPHNPGGTEVIAGLEGEIGIDALDDYNFARVDFLKIDAEGSELPVLMGAEKTVARCRPLIYCEDDRPQNSQALHSWLLAHGYRLYRHVIPLYTPNNHFGYRINVFGEVNSIMILAVPNERMDLRDLTDTLPRMMG